MPVFKLLFTFIIFSIIFSKPVSCSDVAENQSESEPESAQNLEPEIAENDIIHIPTGILISENDLINLLGSSKVVYIGETHDNYDLHKVQLKIIKGIYDSSKGKIAIGMEMFQQKSQEKLDLWIAGKMSEKEFLKDVWYPDWGYEYEYYREIIEFAKNKKIKLVALNANSSTIEKIGKNGIDSLSDEEKKALPEIDLTDSYHRRRVKAVFDIHGKGTMEGDFDSFYLVQCLWDETMAQSAANYLSQKNGIKKQLIVLAGKDHVRYGFGIPKRVFRRIREPYSIVLPIEITIPENKKHNIMNVERVDVPLPEADFFWMVNYSDPEINKVKLGIMALNTPSGVLAHNIEPGSSAEKTGIKTGDIILDVDGVPIADPFDLVYEIRNKVPGRSGKIKILRDGAEQTFNIEYQLGSIIEKPQKHK